MISFFDRGAERFPNADVVHDGTRGWTYAQMQLLTRRIGTALIESGLDANSPVATYVSNHPMGIIAQYGVFRAGAIWLPLNVRNRVDENIEILKMLGAQWLFFERQFDKEIARVKEAVPSLRGFVCIDGHSINGPSLEVWLENRGSEGPWIEKGPNDVISFGTTSGTTGRPKGVMLTNLNWEAMIASYQILMRYRERPIHLVAAPLTHAAGYFAASMMSLGATHILLPKPDSVEIISSIERFKATSIFLPPTLIYMLLAHPRVREFDYSSLRYLMYGGAPMSVQKLREASEVFGPVLCQTFGQTEALMVITFLSAAEHAAALADPSLEARLWSAGRAGPLGQVAIMDDDGRLLPAGKRGEIVGRGNIVMAGYFENPQANAEVSAHGWHHTGDIGMIDQDGYVHIVDRKKDVIISGGFNVFPSEVEQVIWTHPSVMDCAVIGIPHEKWGEAVTAVIELKPNAPFDEAELIALCKDKIGSVKAPKSVIVMEALPRSSIGKVLKREIRDQFWRGLRRAV
jgi:acyl-CoA synthetase (AMP-forming)/AMP-acid ligase II